MPLTKEVVAQRRRSAQSLMSMSGTEDDRVDLLEQRRQVEDDLHRDEQKLLYLTKNIARAAELEKTMARTLEIFDERLLALEGVILPIHQDTLKLVRAQENLEDVGDLLEEAMRQQGVSRRTAHLITTGTIGESLDMYIAALLEIRNARAYFTENAPGNPEVQVLYELHVEAMATIQARTKILLVEDVSVIEKEKLLDMPREAVSDASTLFKTDGSDLIKLVALLLQSENSAELARIFAGARGDAMTELIEGKASVARFMSDGSKVRGPSRRGLSLRRRSGTNLSAAAAAANAGTPIKMGSSRPPGSGHKRNSSVEPKVELAMDMPSNGDPMTATYERGSHPFLKYFSVTATALLREHTLGSTLVGGKPVELSQLLRQLFYTKMDAAIAHGELLVGNMSRRSVTGNAGLSVLDILGTFVAARRHEFDLILSICREQTGVRFHQMCASFAKLARQSLFEFQDFIAGDDVKKLPPDGTVHELALNTSGFITALLAYSDIAGFLLGSDDAAFGGVDRHGGLDINVVGDHIGHLVGWVTDVLETLCDNVSRKARHYEDKAMRCIFLINNYDYILKYIMASPHASVFRERDSQIDTRYLAMIQEQSTAYRQHSWDSLIAHIQIDESINTMHMQKRERESIKERYSKFNDGFEAIVKEQVRYSVPSSEVRARLIEDVIKAVVPQFEKFDSTYRNSGFSVKNPTKYLRFTPEEITDMIKRLFSATS